MKQILLVVYILLATFVLVAMSLNHPERFLAVYLSAIAGFGISLYLLLRARRQ